MQTAGCIVLYVLGYLVKDDAVLLHYRDYATFFAQHYALPGGKVEENETPSQALARELEEELGIKVVGDAPLVHVMYFQGITKPCVVFVYQVDAWSGEPYNKESHKHSQLAWYSLSRLPSPIIPRHQKILTNIQQKVWYSEDALPTYMPIR
jgi:8-oxo-dGTP diphosphatase